MKDNQKVLVLGASGYIGSHLVEELLKLNYSVRAVGRSLKKLGGFSWSKHKNVQLNSVDVLNKTDLSKVCNDCNTAFYLVHSMDSQHKNFEEADRQAARNMIEAAEERGLQRIIYLGGLGDNSKTLSKHLRSRLEVSNILHSGKVPATTLRAAMIIGKGSTSFEILRNLVNRLPVIITPRWVSTESQPIAISNVLSYLVGCLRFERTAGEVYDIGGPDILAYRQLMDIYAEETGLRKRWVIAVPIFSPLLGSYLIRLFTPFSAYIARPLAESLRNRAVCQDSRIKEIIPQDLLDCRAAIKAAQ